MKLKVDFRIDDSVLCHPNKKAKAQADHLILKTIANEKYPEVEPDELKFFIWIFVLLAVLMIFLLMLLFSVKKSKLTKVRLKKMELQWLETFHAGQENLIDWNEDIVLQAEFLPYRTEFEFPIENLDIGDELGRGEFGVVHKGSARGLGGNEKNELEVAVKKSKNLKLLEIKAFADELKIMMFLQKVNKESHVNIINLLGSITVDIKKGEICAILEFCRKGNLKDFVIKNTMHFINQLESGEKATNKICDDLKISSTYTEKLDEKSTGYE